MWKCSASFASFCGAHSRYGLQGPMEIRDSVSGGRGEATDLDKGLFDRTKGARPPDQSERPAYDLRRGPSLPQAI